MALAFPLSQAASARVAAGRAGVASWRRALVVSDLERCWPGYLGARLLARALRNPMTRHDAPASVRRAYAPAELRRLAAAAGLRGARVARRFPFRLVLVWEVAD
jgi:hypothetical protein